MPEDNLYFTTGEFARLCGVAKDTLFYYDKMDILKPEIVKENGYRYYTVRQFYLYDIIAVLKEAGSTLAQIRSYLKHRTPARYLDILAANYRLLQQEKEKLMRMQRQLERAMATTTQALAIPAKHQQLTYATSPEEYLICLPLETTGAFSQREAMFALRDHFTYLADHNLEGDFSLGSMITRAHFQKELYREQYYYSRIPAPVKSQNLHRKPAGRYAVMYHFGAYDTLPDTYACFRRRLAGRKLGAFIYEDDLIDHLAAADESQFIIRLSVLADPPLTGSA